MEENKEYFEEMEEGLRQELSVLAQTIEFNESLVADYKHKLEEEKEKSSHYLQLIEDLKRNVELLTHDKAHLEGELGVTVSKVSQLNEELK